MSVRSLIELNFQILIKKTQIVTHLMPPELGDYNTMVDMLKNVSTPSSEKDYISLYATLNLSSKLFDWDKSSATKDTYINFLMK